MGAMVCRLLARASEPFFKISVQIKLVQRGFCAINPSSQKPYSGLAHLALLGNKSYKIHHPNAQLDPQTDPWVDPLADPEFCASARVCRNAMR